MEGEPENWSLVAPIKSKECIFVACSHQLQELVISEGIGGCWLFHSILCAYIAYYSGAEQEFQIFASENDFSLPYWLVGIQLPFGAEGSGALPTPGEL